MIEPNEYTVITIPGKMLGIKNGKMCSKDGKKVIDKPESRKFKKWLTDYLIENYGDLKFEGKVSIGYRFYMEDNRRIDCSNMLQGIEDCLQKAGIIKDDSWQWCSIAYAEGELAKSKKEVRAEVMIIDEQ